MSLLVEAATGERANSAATLEVCKAAGSSPTGGKELAVPSSRPFREEQFPILQACVSKCPNKLSDKVSSLSCTKQPFSDQESPATVSRKTVDRDDILSGECGAIVKLAASLQCLY